MSAGLPKDIQPTDLHRRIADKVKQLRRQRRWSAQRLSEEISRAGFSWNRSVIANFEHGRRSYLTVEELIALASVLEVSPLTLLLPCESQEPSSSFSDLPAEVGQFGRLLLVLLGQRKWSVEVNHLGEGRLDVSIHYRTSP